MNKDLSDKRKVYTKFGIEDEQWKENPMEFFRDWYLEAENNPDVSEANAMAISTVEQNKFPRTRMVLLKRYTWEGFVFYTNYDSRKGKAIAENPNVCLHFFWPTLERQVIINGIAEKLAENLSDGYFSERPRGSQLGAMVSPQSQEIPNRLFLENKLISLEKEYEGKEIMRPENWGGYIVRPTEMEFWQGRPSRLHDRVHFSLDNDFNWISKRLAP